MHQGEYIKKILKERKITQDTLAKDLNLSRGHIVDKLKEFELVDNKENTKLKILTYLNLKEDDLPKPNDKAKAIYLLKKYNVNYTKKEVNAISLGDIETRYGDNPYIDLHNGQYITIIPLVEKHDHTGYINNFLTPNFMQNLKKHSVVANQVLKGKYVAFRVTGKGMYDGTGESYMDNSIVTCREIDESFWRKRYGITLFKPYVIVHKDGILFRVITDINVEKGTLTCRYLNPDKQSYPDDEINFDDCLQILSEELLPN